MSSNGPDLDFLTTRVASEESRVPEILKQVKQVAEVNHIGN